LLDFNQICNFSICFYKSSQYQISLKSLNWEPLVPHNLILVQGSPDGLLNFQKALRLRLLLLFSGSNEKEPRYACLSATKASHSHRMWTEDSSSIPHLLYTRLLINPIKWRCLLRLLCPVRRPITTLDCVLLKDSNLVFVVTLGSEINFQACLWALPGRRHIAKCWLSTQRLILFLILCLETHRDGSGPTNLWTEPPVARLPAISFLLTPAWPGTQYSPTAWRVEISLNVFGTLVPIKTLLWQPEVFQSRLTSSLRTTVAHYRRLCTGKKLDLQPFPVPKGNSHKASYLYRTFGWSKDTLRLKVTLSTHSIIITQHLWSS